MDFEVFIVEVDPQYQGFAREMHEYLLQNDCKLKMTSAKNGYVVSYQYGKKKRVLMNFVFRKSGLVTRVYADHINQYLDMLEAIPDNMKKAVEKAPKCKRFEETPGCNTKCSGYVFNLSNIQHQKCKYNCFLFEVNDESIPFIKTMIEKELECRVVAVA